MKRLSSLILCAAILLCFSATVYADVIMPPTYEPYIVTNPNGAYFIEGSDRYEQEGTSREITFIPYGTEVLLIHYYYQTGSYHIKWGDREGYVGYNDITKKTNLTETTVETTSESKETTSAKPSTTAKPIETKTVTETTSDVTATDTTVTEPTSYFEETSPAVQTSAQTTSEKAEVKDSIKSSSKMTAVCVAAAAAVALTAGVTIALIRKKKNSDGSNENGR
ncbi:MAG: hypothetical protein J5562_06895 [Clostridia bacterium]|nr:hypothetical protein [Clostridia bacterium]